MFLCGPFSNDYCGMQVARSSSAAVTRVQPVPRSDGHVPAVAHCPSALPTRADV